MTRRARRTAWAAVALAACLGSVSCRTTAEKRPPEAGAPAAPVVPTVIAYVDSDGFDNVLESALVNQDAAVIVRTTHDKPDWGPRLNAWIAAWNRGGRARGRVARGQAPVPRVVIDGDSIREFRLLVNGLLDRVEEAAQAGSGWYAEERARSRRVALLRPYNLRFHMGDDGLIQLVFFHGRRAADYPRFVQELTRSATAPEEPWSRSVECSRCAAGAGRQAEGRLTGRANVP